MIASLNGISTSGWIDTGKELQQACAINPATLDHSNYLDVIKSYEA